MQPFDINTVAGHIKGAGRKGGATVRQGKVTAISWNADTAAVVTATINGTSVSGIICIDGCTPKIDSGIWVVRIGPGKLLGIGAAQAPAWTAPTLINSWVNFGGAFRSTGYRRMGDVVYLRGLITGGTSPSVAFVLPTGYRPTQTEPFGPVGDISHTEVARVDVDSSGNVTVQSGQTDTSGFMSLNGIQFSVT